MPNIAPRIARLTAACAPTLALGAAGAEEDATPDARIGPIRVRRTRPTEGPDRDG